MNNVMLDLETMGSGPRAAIVTIGAVFFDPMTGELGAEFEAHIDLRDSARYGEMDPGTVLWWLRQSDEARAAIQLSEKSQPLNDVLRDLYQWADRNSNGRTHRLKVWGNGASFDNVILRNACQQASVPPMWDYWNDRDVRTVVDIGHELLGFDHYKEVPFKGVPHRAMDDAKYQARYVSAIYQRLRSALAGMVMEGAR